MRVRMHGVGRAALVGCAAAVGTMMVQSPALAADPVPTTSAEAKVLVDKLTTQQHAAEDQYNKVNEDYTKTSAILDQRTAAISLQSDKVAKLRSSIGSLALSRYHNRGQETTQALVTGNTEELIHKLSTIDHVDATLNSSLQNLQSENSYLTELNREQAIDAAKSKKQVEELADLDKSAKDSLARAEALLGQLTDADRKAYEDAERQKAEQEAASRSYNARTATAPTPTPTQPAPAAAAVPTAAASSAKPAAPATSAPAPAASAPASSAPASSAPASSAPATSAPAQQAQTPSNGALKSSANARGNVYTPGSCVWYAYNVRAGMGAPVGSNWGSALSWPSAASAEGFRVDHSPQVGAVFSTMAFGASPVFGHAGVVTSVNGDGSFTVNDMNNPSPFVVTSHSFPASAAGSMFFIH